MSFVLSGYKAVSSVLEFERDLLDREGLGIRHPPSHCDNGRVLLHNGGYKKTKIRVENCDKACRGLSSSYVQKNFFLKRP